MIFVGDIAIPYVGAIKIEKMPERLLKGYWFGNLEGALIANDDSEKERAVVFNDKEAIKDLVDKLHFSGFALANNHILDTGSFEETIGCLSAIRMPYCGAGTNIDTASKPLLLKEGDQ